MNLAHVVETAVLVHLEGVTTSTGHALHTAYDGHHRLYVNALKGGLVKATCRVTVEQLDADPCDPEA